MSETAGPPTERMQCMEIWGGNRAINKNVQAPGIDVFVHSTPYQSSSVGGGDIYYVTSCASGRITRLLLADVSGHGESVAGVAVTLRDLLRQNVNTIRQDRFIEEMNREFTTVSDRGLFATAAVATFFEPNRRLTIGLAGHPYPLYFRASKNRWTHLDPKETDDERIENLPLGIVDESDYPSRHIDTEQGDMFLLYSDAYVEAVDENGEQLGTTGLVKILNEMSSRQPAEIIQSLRESISGMNDNNLKDDDETLLLGQVTATKVRFRDNLMAPFRLMIEARDKTTLD